MRKQKNFLLIAALLGMTAAVGFAQEQFTKSEIELMAKYVSTGSIPLLSDSVTVAAAITLPRKLNALLQLRGVKQDSALYKLVLTTPEKKVIMSLLMADAERALTLLRLWKKIFPEEITAEKTKPQKN